MDFRIIFQDGFLDFRLDFWILVWISIGFLPTVYYEISFATNPSGEADTKLEGQRLSRIVEDYNKGEQVPQSLLNCARYVFHFRASHAQKFVCRQGIIY